MSDFFRHFHARETVLKRTQERPGLPRLLLYVEWLAGQMSRRVIDATGKEHVLTDNVLQSSYRMLTGAQAEESLRDHWPTYAAERATSTSTPAPAKSAAAPAKEAAKAPAKVAAKPAPKTVEAKPAEKKTATSKPAAKSATKPAAAKPASAAAAKPAKASAKKR